MLFNYGAQDAKDIEVINIQTWLYTCTCIIHQNTLKFNFRIINSDPEHKVLFNNRIEFFFLP